MIATAGPGKQTQRSLAKGDKGMSVAFSEAGIAPANS